MLSIRKAFFCLVALVLVSLGAATSISEAQEPGPVTITIEEAIAVSDVTGVFPPLAINVNEGIGVGDGPGVFLPLVLSVNESVSVSQIAPSLTVAFPTPTPAPTPTPTPIYGVTPAGMAALAALLVGALGWRVYVRQRDDVGNGKLGRRP